jgi:hypothetical protein
MQRLREAVLLGANSGLSPDVILYRCTVVGWCREGKPETWKRMHNSKWSIVQKRVLCCVQSEPIVTLAIHHEQTTGKQANATIDNE